MSDFAKSIQADINHYVTRDRTNDASFRQKLDPISKNILRRQNPLELVFEDISTFDAENAIVGFLLREIDLNKKQTDSDFIKSLPSHPGEEFEMQKRIGKLRDIKRFNKKITIITTITMMKEVEATGILSLLVLQALKIEMIHLSLMRQILTIFLIRCLRSMTCNKD